MFHCETSARLAATAESHALLSANELQEEVNKQIEEEAKLREVLRTAKPQVHVEVHEEVGQEDRLQASAGGLADVVGKKVVLETSFGSTKPVLPGFERSNMPCFPV